MDHKRNQQYSHKDAASESSDAYRVPEECLVKRSWMHSILS